MVSFNLVMWLVTPHQHNSWAVCQLVSIDMIAAPILLKIELLWLQLHDTIQNENFMLTTWLTCKPLIGIDITSGGVLCEEPSRAVRKLESNIRLQSSRIKEFIEGLERYLNSSILQVKFVYSCFFFNATLLSFLSFYDDTVMKYNVKTCMISEFESRRNLFSPFSVITSIIM